MLLHNSVLINDIFFLLGLLIWIIGFIIEVVADEQKRRFKLNLDNKGKFISSGLWSYSRHPNYRSFFISCGFEKEMLSAESALNSNDIDTAIASISSNMEKEVAMVGSPADCYDQIAKRTTLGLDLPVLAPFGVSNNIKVDYLNTLKAFAQ